MIKVKPPHQPPGTGIVPPWFEETPWEDTPKIPELPDVPCSPLGNKK